MKWIVASPAHSYLEILGGRVEAGSVGIDVDGSDKRDEIAGCCGSRNLSYDLNPSNERCQVINFSGTPCWNICVAAVARKL